MSDPVSSTILLLDIEKYSERDDVEQAYLRRMLFDLADRVLLAAGIDETRRRRADRGDCVMELIDANASVTALLRTLLTEAPAQLRTLNRTASRSAQMRLRGVVATGYVALDGHDGWVGSDLNHACRLLDAELLRGALRERAQDFALCVSEPVYQGIVRHSPTGVPAEEFHAITVGSKNGPLPAWLHGPVPHVPVPDAPPQAPDRTAHEPRTPAAPPAGPGQAFDFGGATVNGGVFGGTNHGIGGGTFHGDIHLGGGSRER
ncbi:MULTISPECIES: hypothetical protein [unclassified Streptomyces]|uniref:hypothetical protein n=1 Tax=unclassified Streptomyces TaxID=2593676 RepID=UPI00093ADEF8|nr:hypothetical protein [Streptomyces sp. TSRI0281]OKI48123.1 hypothetical protein A6A29_03465 [Streptomyces sp. TSRI0281]